MEKVKKLECNLTKTLHNDELLGNINLYDEIGKCNFGCWPIKRQFTRVSKKSVSGSPVLNWNKRWYMRDWVPWPVLSALWPSHFDAHSLQCCRSGSVPESALDRVWRILQRLSNLSLRPSYHPRIIGRVRTSILKHWEPRMSLFQNEGQQLQYLDYTCQYNINMINVMYCIVPRN